MEAENQKLEKIEKRIWQLMLMAVIVILYLTLTFLAIHFSSFLGTSEKILVSPSIYKYSICLSILILLFCAYMIVQQRRMLNLSRALFKEKETSAVLSRNVKILSSLLEVSSSINSQQELGDILTTITREILGCFDADQSSIMLLDQSSGVLRTHAASGKGSEYVLNALVPVEKGVAGWVLKNDKPLLLNGQVNADDFPGTPKKDRIISSALCVPLKLGEKNIGVLNVNVVERDHHFFDTDLKLLAIFANNASVAMHNAMLSEERTQRIRLQTLFEQYHSPQVVQKLIEQTDIRQQRRGMREKLELTVLFADIRQFTSLLSALRMEDIMDFLDQFYSAMTKAVLDNEGTIDKFIGDEVMAFFGAPLALINPSQNALNAAKEMMTLFQGLREKCVKISPHFEKLGLGIGINTGEVYIGTVGSEKRYEYTVIGDAVILARRLCTAAGSGKILVSEKTLSNITDSVSSEFTEAVSLKGIANPVRVYKIALP